MTDASDHPAHPDEEARAQALRDRAAALARECAERGLPHACFYFSLLEAHFVAQGLRAETARAETLSPFVYAMQ